MLLRLCNIVCLLGYLGSLQLIILTSARYRSDPWRSNRRKFVIKFGHRALIECPCQNNILVDSRGRALVTDVGVSTLLDEITESEHGKTTYGTIRYMAPELVVENPNKLPTSKSDVWSFGCNMIHVSTSTLPSIFTPSNDVS